MGDTQYAQAFKWAEAKGYNPVLNQKNTGSNCMGSVVFRHKDGMEICLRFPIFSRFPYNGTSVVRFRDISTNAYNNAKMFDELLGSDHVRVPIGREPIELSQRSTGVLIYWDSHILILHQLMEQISLSRLDTESQLIQMARTLRYAVLETLRACILLQGDKSGHGIWHNNLCASNTALSHLKSELIMWDFGHATKGGYRLSKTLLNLMDFHTMCLSLHKLLFIVCPNVEWEPELILTHFSPAMDFLRKSSMLERFVSPEPFIAGLSHTNALVNKYKRDYKSLSDILDDEFFKTNDPLAIEKMKTLYRLENRRRDILSHASFTTYEDVVQIEASGGRYNAQDEDMETSDRKPNKRRVYGVPAEFDDATYERPADLLGNLEDGKFEGASMDESEDETPAVDHGWMHRPEDEFDEESDDDAGAASD